MKDFNPTPEAQRKNPPGKRSNQIKETEHYSNIRSIDLKKSINTTVKSNNFKSIEQP